MVLQEAILQSNSGLATALALGLLASKQRTSAGWQRMSKASSRRRALCRRNSTGGTHTAQALFLWAEALVSLGH